MMYSRQGRLHAVAAALAIVTIVVIVEKSALRSTELLMARLEGISLHHFHMVQVELNDVQNIPQAK
jgi:hypothetical protein